MPRARDAPATKGVRMDIQGFYAGRAFDAHEYLGAHVVEQGTVVRAFAPAATGMTVVHHDGFESEMGRIHDGSFWEAWVPDLAEGDSYELRVYLPGAAIRITPTRMRSGRSCVPRTVRSCATSRTSRGMTHDGWRGARRASASRSTSTSCTLGRGASAGRGRDRAQR